VPASDDATWTVARGEHLWHIAEQTLAERAGTAEPVSDGAIAEYLARLIDLNRDALVEPGNPDLIFPGQVVRLPD
jgi:nucleoid-associated protein YgaU